MSLVKISALPVLTSIDAADKLPFEDVSAVATKAITYASLKASLAGTQIAGDLVQINEAGLLPVLDGRNLTNVGGLFFDTGWAADVGTADKATAIPHYVGGGGQPMDDAVIALVKVVIALKSALKERLLPDAA